MKIFTEYLQDATEFAKSRLVKWWLNIFSEQVVILIKETLHSYIVQNNSYLTKRGYSNSCKQKEYLAFKDFLTVSL